MPQLSNTEREKATKASWTEYIKQENAMLEFLEYVPLAECHFQVYSPKLVSILYEVGPELMNIFNVAIGNTKPLAKMDKFMGDGQLSVELDKIWSDEVELQERTQSLSFRRYYDFLEKWSVRKLSTAQVEIIENSLMLTPFKDQTPEWWTTYNGLKHSKQTSLTKATLFTTLMGLSGLFWPIKRSADDLHIDDGLDSKIFKAKNY